MKKVILTAALTMLLLALFTSCLNKKDETIVLDDTHPLALAPDVSWALVTDPYASYKEIPDWGADATGHCRKGDILQVLAKSIDKKNQEWYRFEKGWLSGNSVAIYSNRYKAQTAAEELKD